MIIILLTILNKVKQENQLHQRFWFKTIVIASILILLFLLMISFPVVRWDPLKSTTPFPAFESGNDFDIILPADNRLNFDTMIKAIKSRITKIFLRQIVILENKTYGLEFSPGYSLLSVILIIFSIFYRISRTSLEIASPVNSINMPLFKNVNWWGGY